MRQGVGEGGRQGGRYVRSQAGRQGGRTLFGPQHPWLNPLKCARPQHGPRPTLQQRTVLRGAKSATRFAGRRRCSDTGSFSSGRLVEAAEPSAGTTCEWLRWSATCGGFGGSCLACELCMSVGGMGLIASAAAAVSALSLGFVLEGAREPARVPVSAAPPVTTSTTAVGQFAVPTTENRAENGTKTLQAVRTALVRAPRARSADSLIQAAVLILQAAVSEAVGSELCVAGSRAIMAPTEQATDWQLMSAVLLATCLGLLVALGCLCQLLGRGRGTAQQQAQPQQPQIIAETTLTRTVSTQSQVTYRRTLATPRFAPLPEELQGCFLGATQRP